MARGYAAVFDGESILVDTVSSTERAAMVNWLVVHAGFAVPAGMGDFAIRERFDLCASELRVKIEPVEVTYG